MLEIIKRGQTIHFIKFLVLVTKDCALHLVQRQVQGKDSDIESWGLKNHSWPSRAPKIKKTPQASIRSFTVPKMYSKALTFVPAIIFWLILAAILVARLSLAESPTKRDIEFSYQAKTTAKAWGNVLDTEITMATKNGKKCTGTTLLLLISCYFPHPTDLK